MHDQRNRLLTPLPLLIAALGGAAVGLERQWSGHATGPGAHFGGIRTFTLLGGLGGVAGIFIAAGWTSLAAVTLAASAALVVAGYVARSRHDVDATTEAAALVVLVAGTLAGTGQTALASGIFAATTLLLLEKTRLHEMAARIDDAALRASARFAALALIVLPLLPSGSYGPFGAIKPRELWAIVLFFSGLSFVGWIAKRVLGQARGVVVAGLLGGIVSSTSVTLAFARASRSMADGTALALGTVAASTVMLVRVAIAAAVLNPPVAAAFVPRVAVAFVAGVVVLAVGLVKTLRHHGDPPSEDKSPLQLSAALQMAAMFQAVLIIIGAVVTWWGQRALLLTSALIGLTDLDALTLSLSRNTMLGASQAATALAVGVLSNTLLKMGVAVTVGRGSYRVVVAAVLGTMAALVVAAVWI